MTFLTKEQKKEKVLAVQALREQGLSTEEACAKHSIGKTQFYDWQVKFGLATKSVGRPAGRKNKTTLAKTPTVPQVFTFGDTKSAPMAVLIGNPQDIAKTLESLATIYGVR